MRNIELIPNEYFEDKEFLICAAKKGFVFTVYSKKYKNDFDILYEEIKHNKWFLNEVDPSIFNVRENIFKLGYICPNILLYTSEELLNSFSFMLEYISVFPINCFFRIGDKLSKNPYFFEYAKIIEPTIIMYCDPELYSNIEFMRRINYNSGDSWYGLLDGIIDELQKTDFLFHMLHYRNEKES